MTDFILAATLSPIFGLISVFFYVEAVRGRPFFGRTPRSTSLARGFLFSGLAALQVDLPLAAGMAAAIALLTLALSLLTAAAAIWVWQGWSGYPAGTKRRPATHSGT